MRRRWFASAVLVLGATLLASTQWSEPEGGADLGGAEQATGRYLSRAVGTPARGVPANASADLALRYDYVTGVDGFWRIVRSRQGVWWLLSPSNELEFLNAVTTVQPYQRGRDGAGPAFTSTDWAGAEAGEEALRSWGRRTAQRVRDAGFKSLGAWCHPVFHDLDLPMTRDLNLWAWVGGNEQRLYSPHWRQRVEEAVIRQVTPLRDNPIIIGFYTDNELDWSDRMVGPAAYFDNLAGDDPNRQRVMETIRALWRDAAAFNADWGTELEDLAEIEQWPTLRHDAQRGYGKLFDRWLYQVARDYFTMTSELLRQHAPNHLILGVRYKQTAPRLVVRASRGLTDAQSLNYYVADGRGDLELFRMMHEESGQPIIISEYAFHSLDNRSGNRNTVGFSAQVPDQRARAEGYALFTERLAAIPWVIAAEWFQWMDEPPSGRTLDGEDVNFGIVDIDDRPYEALVQAIGRTAGRLNGTHGASYRDRRDDVWRESFAERPVVQAPYLRRPIRLNGELSDWPAEAELKGIRRSATIGGERSLLRSPRVWLAWTDRGVYVAMEVYDNDIQGAPADGWWWTRDHAEFWINTRPVPPGQESFDKYSHQFFLVPREYPQDGVGGVLGQWHRRGDALEKHLVPHPTAKCAVRVLADRYVFEAFIPAEALHGYDPRSEPELAFNMHVRNYQQAADYFWSAPKEVFTQARPQTWGVLKLAPAPEQELTRGN